MFSLKRTPVRLLCLRVVNTEKRVISKQRYSGSFIHLLDSCFAVYFHTGGSMNNTAHYNGSATTILSGDAPSWATEGNAGIVPNGPTQNIRSGNPGEINVAYLTTSLQDASHAVTGISFSYQYVSGYGPAGRHVGANFTVVLLDACAAGSNLMPPLPTSVLATVYQSPELTMYPFDFNNTGYSPPVSVSATFTEAVTVTQPTRIAFVFNVQR